MDCVANSPFAKVTMLWPAKYLGEAALYMAHQEGREETRFFDRLSEIILDVSLPANATTILAQVILGTIQPAVQSMVLQTVRSLCRQVSELSAT